MLLIFPKQYETETSLTPNRFARKLDGELVEFVPSLNFMAVSKFMKKHKTESMYYGRREEKTFSLFYHKMKKHDGGETGFFGQFEKSENGTKIHGRFRKPVYTYVFAVIWTIVTLFLALCTLALKEKVGALVLFALWLVGIFFMFWDNKIGFLTAYLDTLPKAEKSEKKEITDKKA